MLGISDISLLIVGSLLPVSTDKYVATIHLILLLVIIVIFSMILKALFPLQGFKLRPLTNYTFVFRDLNFIHSFYIYSYDIFVVVTPTYSLTFTHLRSVSPYSPATLRTAAATTTTTTTMIITTMTTTVTMR